MEIINAPMNGQILPIKNFSVFKEAGWFEVLFRHQLPDAAGFVEAVFCMHTVGIVDFHANPVAFQNFLRFRKHS